MTKNYTSTLRNLTAAFALLLSVTSTFAQMDLKTANKVIDFSEVLVLSNQGTATMQNGTAQINIAPEIAALIDEANIDEAVEISIQLEGDSNGVYVSEKNKDSFIITELAQGTSNTKFTWTMTIKK